jgi:ATP-dependent RNA helicase DeaD
MNNLNFEELKLSKDLFKAVDSLGFKQATPIQAQAIPEMITGRDVIGLASTGTGKTAAFSLPLIEKIDTSNKSVQSLVLCPTRELAMQVAVEVNKFLKYKKNITALAIYGGQPISQQLFALRRKPQIIVGTPGRVLDHMMRGSLRMGQVKMLVLDEADEMLDMGFRNDIEQILQVMPDNRQTALFSATMSDEILQLTKRYQKNPKYIKVAKEKQNIAAIEQIYFEVESPKKVNSLQHLINEFNPKLAIVFCNTKRKVDKVAQDLRFSGYSVEGIHGDIRQTKRDRIMAKFRRGGIKILVATGVAARGIDVSNVEVVFNYEIPKDVESYVHRIGRTGRAGKNGKALSLVSRREIGQLRVIERYTKTKVAKQSIKFLETTSAVVSSYAKAFEDKKAMAVSENISRRKQPIVDGVDTRLEQNANKVFVHLRNSIKKDDLTGYSKVLGEFVDDQHTPEDIAAALLKIVMDKPPKRSKRRNFH